MSAKAQVLLLMQSALLNGRSLEQVSLIRNRACIMACSCVETDVLL